MLGGSPRRGVKDVDSDLAAAPPELRQVIKTACAYDVSSRFQSVDDFRGALRPLLGAEGVGQEAGVVVCPNPKCEDAVRSVMGYFWGPRILDKSESTFCESCGTRWLRCCPRCSSSLSPDIRVRLTKESKHSQDRGVAHCGACGEKIFEAPKCLTCRSLLKVQDMDRNTAVDGCSKCSRADVATAASKGYEAADDEDIPF